MTGKPGGTGAAAGVAAGGRQRAGAGREAGARSGRRAGDSGTRAAILAAARRRFAQNGYDGATIRAIAADAAVDPALVHHFYGTKERLFAAAMQLPVVPSELITSVLAAERSRLGDEFAGHLGEIIVRTMLTVWDVEDARASFVGMLRSAATNEQAARTLREFLTSTIMAALAQAVVPDGGEPVRRQYRASLVASQIIGLGFTRWVLRLEPITSASAADLAAAIGPTVQRYLTGDLTWGLKSRPHRPKVGRPGEICP
jgi:AcrR family transcriptional regulator